jgi:co-chaperonin GroES (HSP10)
MLVPLFDNIVVKREKATEQKTAGGIVVPIKADASNPDTAIVLAIGPDVSNDLIGEGARVVIGKFTGTEVLVDGIEKVTVLKFTDVLGIVLS